MKYIPHLLLAALLLPLFTSCEVEFSPNAKWKNVPVVYCVLDQDDDTTWVRVERCHLSNEGVYTYGSNPDSVDYREGEITVSILAFEGDQMRDSIPCAYTLRMRDSGAFAHGMRPVYGCETSGRLRENYDYFLRVRGADGRLLASAGPVRLIQCANRNTLVSLQKTVFGFYDIVENSSANCNISWNALPHARVYQPLVRFYYAVSGERRFVDLPCPRKALDYNATSGSVAYARSSFLTDLKTMLASDTSSSKEYLKRVDIYLTCCTEDLNTYMSTAASSTAIEQGREAYSNIEGGVGIFAARRTHLYKSFDADGNTNANSGLYWYLKQLGIGFDII